LKKKNMSLLSEDEAIKNCVKKNKILLPIAPIPDKEGLYLIGTVRCFINIEGDDPYVRVGGDEG